MATALLEKQETRQPEVVEAETGVVPYLWTVEAFTKASAAGVFGYSERLELVQGRIIKFMGQGPRHATLASQIADMLRDAAKKQFAIREEKPFRIDFDGEPIPDVMVLSGRQADYDDHQPVPEDVRLLVEVSVTTVEYDLGEKALLYAQAGIADYWAVLVNEAAIVVHREPSLQGYQNVMRLAGTDTLSPLALPEVAWTINELLGRTEASEEN
jgi:Uma2 family endonuclease